MYSKAHSHSSYSNTEIYWIARRKVRKRLFVSIYVIFSDDCYSSVIHIVHYNYWSVLLYTIFFFTLVCSSICILVNSFTLVVICIVVYSFAKYCRSCLLTILRRNSWRAQPSFHDRVPQEHRSTTYNSAWNRMEMKERNKQTCC